MSKTSLPFAQLPGEVLLDRRLTPTHIRVLIALYMHVNKKNDTAWPKRETLASLTGLHESKISRATTELEVFGWLTKTGNGGRSKSCSYRIHVPETVSDSVTVLNEETVSDLDTVSTPETVADLATDNTPETVAKTETVSDSVTVSDLALNPSRIGHQTLAKSDRGIEHTKNIPEQTIKDIGAEASKKLPEWVPEIAWAEWVKFKGKKLTAKARTLNLNTLEKLWKDGHDPTAVIEQSIERGWTGLFPLKTQITKSRNAAQPENFKGKSYVGTDESAISWL